MARNRTIIDCYTDEPAGLGVPPFLGVWPRYIAGQYKETPAYLTIDDIRIASYRKILKDKDYDPPTGKTRTDLINHTRNQEEIRQILKGSDQFIIIVGVQTPGRYLSARPSDITEIKNLLKSYKATKILTGPAAFSGTQAAGRSHAQVPELDDFNEIRPFAFDTYEDLQNSAIEGAKILKQIPHRRIIEIETGRGCSRKDGCSFCTEPLKYNLQWRKPELIIDEVKTLKKHGANAFRLGKQSCIFSYQNGDITLMEVLLKGLKNLNPEILHIDNSNPSMVNEERTKLFVKYLTPGSTAAMGVESFDPKVAKLNNLNTNFEETYKAIKLINEIGGERSDNGCHYFLPGINILLGLAGETPETLDINLKYLKKILDDGLLVRRINIRQVIPFPGTRLYKISQEKKLTKNRNLYKDWIHKVRNEIDLPMLQKLFPIGTVLKDLYTETHEGNVTFLRQLGSYPIVVGVRERLPLGQKHNIKVIGHMLRSLEGKLN